MNAEELFTQAGLTPEQVEREMTEAGKWFDELYAKHPEVQACGVNLPPMLLSLYIPDLSDCEAYVLQKSLHAFLQGTYSGLKAWEVAVTFQDGPASGEDVVTPRYGGTWNAEHPEVENAQATTPV